MAIPIVHHPEYVAPLPAGHRFPMAKFGLLYDYLVETGIAGSENVFRPELPRRDTLTGVHTPAYIDAFASGALSFHSARRIGLPWSPQLVRRTTLAVGGTLLTARLALVHGLACNTAGGTHHAFPDAGAGFCIYNDLAVTARQLTREGTVSRVLILDLDVHQGDGTAYAFRDDPAVITVSMHCGDNFPFRKQHSDVDIPVAAGTGDEEYLDVLRQRLPGILDDIRPELVIYDAGVDPHREDRLGKLALSDSGLAMRDRLVIEQVLSRALPLAVVIGGGYDTDVHRLARRHGIVHHEAAAYARVEGMAPQP
jgi:acetoin utilization deacetylase AcuC-like enzyme